VQFVTAPVQFKQGPLPKAWIGSYHAAVTRANEPAEITPLSRAELLGIFAFWTLLAVMTAANRLGDERELAFNPVPRSVPIALAFQQMYLWALLTPLVFWLAQRFSVDKSTAPRRILVLLVFGILIAAFVDQINFFLVRLFEARPEGHGIGDGRFAGRGGRARGGGGQQGAALNFLRGPMILNHFVLYTGVLAAGIARDYFLRFRARERETLRLQSETAQLQSQLAQARLAALNAQLNPHFLFNTLHAVSSLVERDPRGVRRMIARLSELLRYTLNGGGENEVPLEQEISFLERYLDIMRIRFQGQLEVVVHVAGSAAGALVPNLILQPLVENAVKHGVDKVAERGRIEIDARREDARLVLSVSDNGPGVAGLQQSPADAEGGVGLENIRQRLDQLYGDAQSLTLREREGGGTVATIVMPFRTASELRTTSVEKGANS
jgi:two-component system LytT family sensor kinase